MLRIWIGRRESDILTYTPHYFDYSITFYGSNKNNNYSYCLKNRIALKYSHEFCDFINSSLQSIIRSNDDEFYLYFYSISSKKLLLKHYPIYEKHCKNCNDYKTLSWFDNKIYMRLWLSNFVDVPSYKILSKADIKYNNLIGLYPDIKDFVVQIDYSAGGDGTYKISQNSQDVYTNLSLNHPYLTSPYLYPSISACCHVIVGKNETIIFPIGEQIISHYDNRLSYCGTDYSLEDRLSKNIVKKCKDFIEIISKKISETGYRGICGYDFLIYNNTPFFIEVNPRYMGSSYLVNYILKINNLPSLFELNDIAFLEESLEIYKERISKIKTNYITHTLYNESDNIISNPKIPFFKPHLYLDGLMQNSYIEPGGLIYRYFKKV